MQERLLRSVLYMPGANQRAMDKARGLPCDAVIFDLEDAVAPDQKAAAREQVLAQWRAGGYGARQLAVRANGIDSPWGRDDLRALAEAGVDTIVLPKVDSAEQLTRCVALLRESGAPGDFRLWGMIETPRGVENAADIFAVDALELVLMGTTDLAHELRIPSRPDRLGLLYALSRCVNAARVSRKPILDGVYLDIKNRDGFAAECEQGRALGFDGKTLIHPSQLEDANRVFGFGEAEIDHARRVIDAWEAAEASGKGVAVLDGKLVETMHVDGARRLLAQAQQKAQLEETQ